MQEQLIPVSDYLELSLFQALGRITAQPIFSPSNKPSFDNSAMDGYAVRMNDITINRVMPIAGTIFAGIPFTGKWPNGSVLRIMTGAKIPTTCNVVVMQEHIEHCNNGIVITQPVYVGQNIRRMGEEIKINSKVLSSGTRLGIAELSLLASLGIKKIHVLRKLRVAILSIGNELQTLGKSLLEGKIYDINRFTLMFMLNQLGCEVIDLGIVEDNMQDLCEAFNTGNSVADVVITSGGVSVGEMDFTKKILENLGTIILWKLAIKPGKPFLFGQLKNSLFCGLPGNTVSATVTFYHLVQPMLLRLMGQTDRIYPLRQKARAIDFLKKSPGRLEFQRGILSCAKDGVLEVSSTGLQDSHIFSSFVIGDCFIVLECERGNVYPGEWVEIEYFNNLFRR
ncbi:hypothetical protein HHS_07290 [Candidatus Pantoea carbekii]|uniref:Molybdopterin molybdenumtransferase n=2 Tax=Candidatus Pantoea carbekii TaxID=1235990 RepID=U3U8K9_9GAMM|nr:hypothetical protein HHS_07290 [Candidatus Pantoea carbekii]